LINEKTFLFKEYMIINKIMPFYAVAEGKNIGIFLNWNECNNSINGYKNALYKKFDTKEEANNFIELNSKNKEIDNIKIQKEQHIISFVDTKDEINDSIELNNINIVSTNIDFIPDYYVYTDGACYNNGRDNALAGIGIFFGIDDIRNVSKKIEGRQTNNVAELSAIIETYSIIENDIVNGKKIAIVTDSEYALKCITSYGEKCCENNWKKEISNKELVKKVYEMYKNKPNIKFIHIKAHTNNRDIHSIGNCNADKLANSAIGLECCPYITTIKIYLIVPFSKKDEVKKLGGVWDSDKKKWFIYDNNKNIDQILSIFKKE
jgi:ribonuclease HI